MWFTVWKEGLSFESAVHLHRNMIGRVYENVVLKAVFGELLIYLKI